MTHKQRAIRYRWFRRLGWVGIIALGFQTAAPAAEAGVRAATRHYRAWQHARQQALRKLPDVRVLRKAEMQHLKGRGRIPSLAGQAKWDIIDNGVNLRTRNYTYTATDLTLPGAIGIPVSVVRTWNANDDREGPFGIGWSWSLDVRQAAGGLIKRKAAPSRTVPTQINNGRNLNVAKIEVRSGGPSVQVIQVDGAQCQDLSGEQWIVWRDADGLYTPPPWDHNEYESTYQSVLIGSGENQYLRDYAVTTKVTTPDGTVYYYEAVRQRDGSIVVVDNAGNEVYAEQVLKLVKDRHGNSTIYTYQMGEVEHIYYTESGERRSRWVWKPFVQSVTNACGYSLVVQWNFADGAAQVAHPRVLKISSYTPNGTLLETIEYVYQSDGDSVREVKRHREGVTRLLAAYEYTSWRVREEYRRNLPPEHWEESQLLSAIRDADGVTTQIQYNSDAFTYHDPRRSDDNWDVGWYRVAVKALVLPGGEAREYNGHTQTDLSGCIVRLRYRSGNEPCIQRYVSYKPITWHEDDPIDGTSAMRVRVFRQADVIGSFHLVLHERLYGGITQNLKQENWEIGGGRISPDTCTNTEAWWEWDLMPDFIHITEDDDLRTGYALITFLTRDYLNYNCFGQPLRVRQTRTEKVKRNNYWEEVSEILTIQQTEYYGKEYYYQKAWEVDAKGRRVRYFYFDRNAPQGYKGQLQAVYMDSISTTVPVSEVLEYNQHGQPVLTRALQRLNPPRYVYTKTFYNDTEGEGDDATRQPQKVIEDYRYAGDSGSAGGINRISTTHYDEFGRPIYQSVYARDPSNNEYANPRQLVRRLHTVYETGSDQVQMVERVNANNQRIQVLSEYHYTPAGRLVSAIDHLSSVENRISYEAGTGRVQSSEEYWQNQLRYRWDYAYTGADLTRKTLTIYTGNQTQVWQWHYKNFITGSFHPWNRVFTRVIMEPPAGVSVPVPLVVDYVYDLTGQLRAARFNVTPNPASGVQELFEEPMSRQEPLAYAFAWYVYDGLGRLNDLRYYKAQCTASNPADCEDERNYSYQPLMRFAYFRWDENYTPAYDETNNRLQMEVYDYSTPDQQPVLVRTEQYQYDALDRLVRVDYWQADRGSWFDSWTYDVMGNRYGAGNPAYDGLNRLTQFNGAAIQHDLLGNRLQDGRYLYQWDALNRLVGMQAYQASGWFKALGDSWRFAYRADGLRVVREKVSQAVADGGGEGGGSSRTEYLYDGQMPVCEQEFAGSTLRTTRVNFLGARGIEAVVAIDHARRNQVSLRWLLYDGHGNLVRLMAPDYTLSAFQWRGVWGEVQGSLGAGRGYCANLGHPEDETGLVYMRARYYEPATGRFISEDPARDGVNWYLYADGNPVNGVDPDGQANWMDAVFVISLLLYAPTVGILMARFFKLTKEIGRVRAVAETAEALAKSLHTAEGGVVFERLLDYLEYWQANANALKHAETLSETRGRILHIVIAATITEIAILGLEIYFGEWL
jgi:RHS repeat-associated protein